MKKANLYIVVLLSFVILSMSGVSVFAESSSFANPNVLQNQNSNVLGRAADEGTYSQDFLVEESGEGSRISSTGIDWRGDYYVVKRNKDETESYLFKNYSPTNNTTPFITVQGKINDWDVTPDENISYFYYKLSSEDGLYRLPLKQDAHGAEYKEFEFAGDTFLFDAFTLMEDPNKFLLMTEHDINLKVTIGLFSFDGNTTPSYIWTCMLPQEWKDTYKQTGTERGYSIIFEATTNKIWMTANKTHWRSNTSWANRPHWFFNKELSQPGELLSYDPSSEIPGWDNGNYKLLSIGSYSRLVRELTGNNAYDDIMIIKEFDPVAKKLSDEFLAHWVDKNGNTPSIGEFFKINDSGSATSFGIQMDAQKNIYANIVGFPNGESTWNATFQRFARFKPAQPVEQPEADASVKNVDFNISDDITLRASEFKAPSGYKAVGSRWRIYKKTTSTGVAREASSNLILEVEQSGPASTYKISAGVIDTNGFYEWQMSYDWEYSSSHETLKGATNWSDLATFSIGQPSGNSGGGGGCASGLPLLSIFALPFILYRKK